jgi:aryl-alcohol dehydrogenase-like predicted oxidoreductase
LGTDHIDIYLAHHYDESTPLEETLSAFDSLVRDGKIRYYGLCNFTAWQTCKAIWIADRSGFTPPVCVQNSYSLLDRILEGEMFDLAHDQGLGVMAYSPLAIGLLSGIYSADASPPKNSLWGRRWRHRFEGRLDGVPDRVLKTLREVATDLGKTPAQVALAWVLAHPEVSVAVMGCDTIRHLDDNLGSIGWTLDDEHLTRLNNVSL